MKRFLILIIIFNFLFTIDQIVETYDNGMPKIIRAYTQAGKNLVIKKEIGYYINGVKKYEKTYKNNQVSNMIGWTEDGQKEDNPSDFIAIKSNKEKKINQIETENKVQDNKITYMKYKIDSLKIELSNYQIAFDEYRRENQQELALIISDIKAEGSKRKAEDRRLKKILKKTDQNITKKLQENQQQISNRIKDIEHKVNRIKDIEYKVDRIKPKSFMTEKEYLKKVGNFKKMKGRLEWPVEGYIEKKFGVLHNKKIKTVTENIGIEIKCKKNNPVKAVMDGIVSRSNFISGIGNIIIINHGNDYSTVYSNINNILVREGDYIKEQQEIATSEDFLSFQMWKGSEVLNPENWFIKK